PRPARARAAGLARVPARGPHRRLRPPSVRPSSRHPPPNLDPRVNLGHWGHHQPADREADAEPIDRRPEAGAKRRPEVASGSVIDVPEAEALGRGDGGGLGAVTGAEDAEDVAGADLPVAGGHDGADDAAD